MKDLKLPAPVAAYFEADRDSARAVARCFTDDGRVVDEGRTHVGPVAIEAWRAAAAAAYSYAAEPLALARQDDAHIVTSRVTGDFPGSPVDLRYNFMLERGKVASLEITP